MTKDNSNKKSIQAVLVESSQSTLVQTSSVAGVMEILQDAVLERRLERIAEIDARLKALEEAGYLKMNDLKGNEAFVDIATQAINFSIKTSNKEKIKVFQNVIVNSALGEHPDQMRCSIFLNLIDSFTPLHIKILSFFQGPEAWFKAHSQKPPSISMGSVWSILDAAFPELKNERAILNLIWNDLGRAGFHSSSELGTTMTRDGIMGKRTTALADEFLKFIAETNTK